MKSRRRWIARPWMFVTAAVVLKGGHVVLPYLVAHRALSGTVVSSLIVVAAVVHLGLLGAFLGSLRARFGRR